MLLRKFGLSMPIFSRSEERFHCWYRSPPFFTMDAKWEVKNGRVLANDFGSPRKTKKLDPDAPLDETVADPAASAGPPAVYMP